VVSMLGDLTAFAASFFIFGDVIAAGALGIAQFYVFHPDIEMIVGAAVPAVGSGCARRTTRRHRWH
jgi:hypothetical protein